MQPLRNHAQALGLLLFFCTFTFHGAAASEADEQLEKLYDEAWEFNLNESPELATSVGDHRANNRLDSVRVKDYLRRDKRRREFLQRLQAIDRQALSDAQKINYDMFSRKLRDAISEADFQGYLIPITNRDGFHISFPELHRRIPMESVQDYENYIGRLRDFSRYTDEHIALMRQGIERGMVLPAVSLENYRDVITPHIVSDPTRSQNYTPFKKFPESFDSDTRERLSKEAQQAISESVVPGYQRFLDFLHDEYVPAARGQIGASALPHGREYYRYRVRHFTTLDISPEEVHRIGLEEVARIRGEMGQVIEQTGFEGDFASFVQYLRSDPRFYPTSKEQLLEKTAAVLKKMDGELPRLFKTLPRMPYGIREVPAFIAPLTTAAYYMTPAGDGTRAGFYYINTYNLKSRPLYQIEALSLHEAVPGHHLQLALQQELENVPPFRRFSGVTAFIEGWGLYSERLGLEVGFYEDPYSNFGRLSYEAWRACRLVVDTGIHYQGWTRQQAIDYMAENTGLSLHNITAEVDRYISWPGQALAYKMGELKIRQLRALAEKELGTNFDIREFHDVVLRNGAIPLDVLDAQVHAYISNAGRAATE